MRKIIFSIILLGIVIFGASPYYIAHKLQQAYADNNDKYIIKHTNFETLQYNLKSQFNYRFNKTIAENPMIEKLGGEPLKVASRTLIEQTINEVITPHNFDTLFDSGEQLNKSTIKLVAIWIITSDSIEINISQLIQDVILQKGNIYNVVENQVKTASSDLVPPSDQFNEAFNRIDLYYCGFNCFNISGEFRGYPLTIKLQRYGLINWKIIDVVLP